MLKSVQKTFPLSSTSSSFESRALHSGVIFFTNRYQLINKTVKNCLLRLQKIGQRDPLQNFIHAFEFWGCLPVKKFPFESGALHSGFFLYRYQLMGKNGKNSSFESRALQIEILPEKHRGKSFKLYKTV